MVELLEGGFHGASSFLLPQQHQRLSLQDVSLDGQWDGSCGLMAEAMQRTDCSENHSCLNVAALESCGPPGLGDFLDGASRRREKGRQEEKRGL